MMFGRMICHIFVGFGFGLSVHDYEYDPTTGYR